MSCNPALLFQIEPVSSLLATTESCLPPIWIKRCAMNSPPPWRNPAPEKRWCRRSVRAKITDPWLAACRVQSPTGSPGRRPGYNNQAVTADPHPDSLVHAQTPLLVDLPSPNHSDETAFHIERLFRLQHVVARPRQFVRQRLGLDCFIGSCRLALEEAFGLGTEAACEVGCFDEGAYQVGIAVLGVASPFFLPFE